MPPTGSWNRCSSPVGCSRKRSMRRTSLRWCPNGPVFRWPRCWRERSAKLVHMEGRLGRRVIGQEKALASVSNAVRRSRAGLQDQDRPVGSFIFLGPTGVGKTELARALAEFLFDNQKAMVRLDMSEFLEKHSVARLIGAPPGLRGLRGGRIPDRGRQAETLFGNPVRRDRESPPEVFNLLLQILEDGRLTDGKGRTVDFRNTLIVMTSNLAGATIQEMIGRDPQEIQTRGLRGAARLLQAGVSEPHR